MGISQLISLKTGSSLQRKFKFLRFLGVNHPLQTILNTYFKMAGVIPIVKKGSLTSKHSTDHASLTVMSKSIDSTGISFCM